MYFWENSGIVAGYISIVAKSSNVIIIGSGSGCNDIYCLLRSCIFGKTVALLLDIF